MKDILIHNRNLMYECGKNTKIRVIFKEIDNDSICRCSFTWVGLQYEYLIEKENYSFEQTKNDT